MAQAGKGRLNFRCPSCFMRDIDMDMFYDKEKGEVLLPALPVSRHGGGGPGEKRAGALSL